ncbi:helix-turn-helix transcriptional regulator [Streptomyces sp. HNM0645]|uniref:helix-turn-helix domain-containing protein n=1 Tax=Streptomyces sp. HNM0645 TaxID=2782343 RepID=UPI0024B70811|nr:helix-turn-helix transcriptional regulator [Streptomyces sp. HNM0645]MDI9885942.1 helix-turn-helix transcriptional regulator [Streptomyces sp. HNM0645]
MGRGPRTSEDLPVSRTVSKNIYALRIRRGWSQRALARATEGGIKAVGFSTVCRIEKARDESAKPVIVGVDDLVALAAALGFAPERLLVEPKCFVCLDVPPAGFACRTCGAAS